MPRKVGQRRDRMGDENRCKKKHLVCRLELIMTWLCEIQPATVFWNGSECRTCQSRTVATFARPKWEQGSASILVLLQLCTCFSIQSSCLQVLTIQNWQILDADHLAMSFCTFRSSCDERPSESCFRIWLSYSAPDYIASRLKEWQISRLIKRVSSQLHDARKVHNYIPFLGKYDQIRTTKDHVFFSPRTRHSCKCEMQDGVFFHKLWITWCSVFIHLARAAHHAFVPNQSVIINEKIDWV